MAIRNVLSVYTFFMPGVKVLMCHLGGISDFIFGECAEGHDAVWVGFDNFSGEGAV